MTFAQFESSLNQQQPPEGLAEELSPYLTALWREKRGDWDAAHEIVQDISTKTAAHLHAYLHRREGDESNARYWYRQAGVVFPSGLTLDEEWRDLVARLLQ
jgi:DNA-directed RNA polymerase specialized sigma24 family protein